MSSIPFELQYFVEKDRNEKFEGLVVVLIFIVLGLHGVFFHWIPRYLRSKRFESSLNYKPYFKFLKYWDLWTSCIGVNIPYKKDKVFVQPSIALLGLVHLTISGVFSFVETIDLDYQPRRYIIAKRLLRVAMGNLPALMLLIMKHDLITAITGLQHDRIVFLHLWLGRIMWLMVTVHVGLSIQYWLDLNFEVMIFIPPQIFGMIAYSCFFMLTWASNRWIRRWSYEFFLLQHRVFAFIMLLLAYFHNPANHAVVLISVHLLVADRVITRILGFIHKRCSPNKGLCEFELLDSETVLITIPVTKTWMAKHTWYTKILPKFSTWNPGQHILINVRKISLFQYHPFTIASLEDTGEIKIVLRKQKGFTKKLYNTLEKLKEEQNTSDIDPESLETIGESRENSGEITQIETDQTSFGFDDSEPKAGRSHTFEQERSNSISDTTQSINESTAERKGIIKLKLMFAGPYGAKHQPFLPFDTSIFFGAGSGGSFIFPVALDLVNQIKQRDDARDYLFRPQVSTVHIFWVIRRQANENWYSHIIELLKPHIDKGRVLLSIYITQEINPKLTSISSNETEGSTGKMVKQEQITESGYKYCDSVDENDGIERIYGRPDIENLIKFHSARLILNGTDLKSLAVSSCGPSGFTNLIKEQCQVNRKLKASPDIYCYSESF